MRKFLLLLLSGAFIITLIAQDKMYVFRSDKTVLGAPINLIDSIAFSNDGSMLQMSVAGSPATFTVATLDSINFGSSTDSVSITYIGNTVQVVNPLFFEGVNVTVNGADVLVTSTNLTKTVHYCLSGTTSEGMFKIYSAKAFHLELNGVSITNSNGPAINNQCQKSAYVLLKDGSENTLTDGPTYAAATMVNGLPEDQDATFFSEGQLIFSGNGKLTINGKGSLAHGLNSDDFIQINSGTIVVASAVKDGINTNDGFIMSNGSVSVTSTGDGIDAGLGNVSISGGTITLINGSANVNGITCDSTMAISGGTLSAFVMGNQSKGLKSGQAMTLSGGIIQMTALGGVVLSPLGLGNDPSYCTAIKCDTNITVSGANITITHSGVAGKGISTATDFTMNSGNITITTSGGGAIYTNDLGAIDAYSAACISANGRVDLLGGNVSATSTGMGGKGISADGIVTIGSETGNPTVTISTAGASIKNSTGTISYTEAKAMKSDDNIYLLNGTVLINTTGEGEGIDTKKSINMEGGTVVVQGSATNDIRSIDFGTAFNINGGTLMVSGPYRTKTIPKPSISSKQQSLFGMCTNKLTANTLFHIQDPTTANIVTYKPSRTAYYFIYSSPKIKAGTNYSIYSGGSNTGTTTNGMYDGGTYSGGTARTSFTPVSTATVNTVTF